MIGFGGLGNISLDDYISDSSKKTWPPAGSATISFNDDKEALFISATWTLRCRVDGKVLYESKTRDTSHPVGFISQWSRYILRRHAKELRELGVDVKAEYVALGGKEDELSL